MFVMSECNVQVDLAVNPSKYDDCNQLVITAPKSSNQRKRRLAGEVELPGSQANQSTAAAPPNPNRKKQKRRLAQQKRLGTDKPVAGAPKALTHKERKQLQKIVSVKEKKKDRKNLWAELEKQRLPEEESVAALISSKAMYGVARKKEPKTPLDAGAAAALVLKNWAAGQDVVSAPADACSSADTSDCSLSDEEEEAEDEALPAPVQEELVEVESVASAAEELPIPQPMEVVEAPPLPQASVPELPVVRAADRFVLVARPVQLQAQRLALPIIGMEQAIMEQLTAGDVLVVSGDTGCGKTTQLPQFLYEAGFCRDGRRVAVTEPRRVAAVTMAARVAAEMGLSAAEVSYQVRHEGSAGTATRIKFLTEGVLLRELSADLRLRRYSAVIVDEAHERSVYTDLLLGLLSRVVRLRRDEADPLKLVVMSATLRVADFAENTRLFGPGGAPVVRVAARQHPVGLHWARRTPANYMTAAYLKVQRLHLRLPPGGVLVFLTGAQEVHTLCRWLENTFNRAQVAQDGGGAEVQRRNGAEARRRQAQAEEQVQEQEEREERRQQVSLDSFAVLPSDEAADWNGESLPQAAALPPRGEEGDALEGGDTEGAEPLFDAFDADGACREALKTAGPVHVVPLYSLLPPDKQALAFQPPPDGHRLIVVSTNVAETSVTIPGIRYVIDCGMVKRKIYDKATGAGAFCLTRISKASAEQRAGRAGRTGPGHCYRLYSSQVFEDSFPAYSEPEILSRPADEVVLHTKLYLSRALRDIELDVSRFPFPSPPCPQALAVAEERLLALGALRRAPGRPLSARGRALTRLPLPPRLGTVLLLAVQDHALLGHALLLAAVLSVPQLLEEAAPAGADRRAWESHRAQWARAPGAHSFLLGDAAALMGAVRWAEAEAAGLGASELPRRCLERGVRWRALTEVRKLRKQLTDVCNAVFPALREAALFMERCPAAPTPAQSLGLRRLLHVTAPLACRAELAPDLGKRAYRCTALDCALFIHPASVHFRSRPMPGCLVFQEALEANGRMYMRGVTVVEVGWEESREQLQLSADVAV